MAIRTRTYFKDLWVQLFTPQEVNYDDVWDSHERISRVAMLAASLETSMQVRWQGDVVPTLAKEANGEYLLTLGAQTGLVSFRWKGINDTLTASNSLKLKVVDTDGNDRHCVCHVHSQTTGDEYGQLAGVNQKRTNPQAGQTLLELSNMNNVPGEWLIVAVVS